MLKYSRYNSRTSIIIAGGGGTRRSSPISIHIGLSIIVIVVIVVVVVVVVVMIIERGGLSMAHVISNHQTWGIHIKRVRFVGG